MKKFSEWMEMKEQGDQKANKTTLQRRKFIGTYPAAYGAGNIAAYGKEKQMPGTNLQNNTKK